jgi:hypothetical protein
MIDEFSTHSSHPLQVHLRFSNLRPKGQHERVVTRNLFAKRPHLLAEMRIMQDGQG